MQGETSGWKLTTETLDIGHLPYSRSCLIVLQEFNGEDRWQMLIDMGSTPRHKWAVAISQKKGPARLVSSKISMSLMVYKFAGLLGALRHSWRAPIAIISQIMAASFILVVRVETPIVYDHLDYCFKIKEKEGNITRGELFSSSLHITPNVPASHMSYKSLWFINILKKSYSME